MLISYKTFKLQWAASTLFASRNPVLKMAEFAYEVDTNRLRIGDGVQHLLARPTFIAKNEIQDLIAQSSSSGLIQSVDVSDRGSVDLVVGMNLVNVTDFPAIISFTLPDDADPGQVVKVVAIINSGDTPDLLDDVLVEYVGDPIAWCDNPTQMAKLTALSSSGAGASYSESLGPNVKETTTTTFIRGVGFWIPDYGIGSFGAGKVPIEIVTAPDSITATNNGASIRVRVSLPDNPAITPWLNILRSTSTDGPFVRLVDLNGVFNDSDGFVDKTVELDMDYYYQARMVNGFGPGPLTDSFGPVQARIPVVPTGFNVVDNADGTFTFSWDDDASSDVINIYASSDTDGAPASVPLNYYVQATSNPFINNPDLTSGTSYWFQATRTAGDSESDRCDMVGPIALTGP